MFSSLSSTMRMVFAITVLRARLCGPWRFALASACPRQTRPESLSLGYSRGPEDRGRRMIRIGVDFGGTKIEAAAIDAGGQFVSRVRAANPGDYAAAIETVCALVDEAEREAGVGRTPVGIGMPGSISPKSGRVRNSNSVWLNGTTFDKDVEAALGRPVRVENDANCFALSEATDGVGEGARVV